jgi:hypothetical protein
MERHEYMEGIRHHQAFLMMEKLAFVLHTDHVVSGEEWYREDFTAVVQVAAYATYLVELAMLDYGMLKYSYSMLAAAAVFTANKALARSPEFPHSLKRHAGFTEDGVLPCAIALGELHRSAPSG